MSSRFNGESFTVGTGERAVLLLHGFTASTQEVESLGLKLSEAGITVHAPLLPGHNRSFAEFSRTRAADYYTTVEQAFDKLAAKYKSVSIVGLSFGATLALHLAARCSVARLIALAPAIYYYDRLATLAWLLQLYRGKVLKRLKPNPETGELFPWDLFKPEACRERIAYPWFAFPQLQSTRQFMRQVRRELTSVVCPLLIMHSKKDTTTKWQGSQYLYEQVSSQEKQLVWLEQSGHIITCDYEAVQMSTTIISFLQPAHGE